MHPYKNIFISNEPYIHGLTIARTVVFITLENRGHIHISSYINMQKIYKKKKEKYDNNSEELKKGRKRNKEKDRNNDNIHLRPEHEGKNKRIYL